ncbi:DUF1127 domain-containing protein [Tropicimonas sp. TH_r6]|uniref:DUF1127 domain-containing protein n=1 Tax=Tropicimonas sp. TH_r6 TaxID=3082085 RepID=UPI002955B50D|nr:DUF1127 domain-containing protein [Tropicimonas sp. TH_r6]MDV7142625.1 DUF1127 domain-containing protein [Tropicimonas sp. TH_r6]
MTQKAEDNRSASWMTAAFRGARARLDRSRTYHRALNELSALTDGELRELGLSREMIRPVAQQAAHAA